MAKCIHIDGYLGMILTSMFSCINSSTVRMMNFKQVWYRSQVTVTVSTVRTLSKTSKLELVIRELERLH